MWSNWILLRKLKYYLCFNFRSKIQLDHTAHCWIKILPKFLLCRAVVAILADDSRQAFALSRLLVARAADGEVRVAAAPLAAVVAEVPESGHAPFALLPDHAGLASALSRLEVTLEGEKAIDKIPNTGWSNWI